MEKLGNLLSPLGGRLQSCWCLTSLKLHEYVGHYFDPFQGCPTDPGFFWLQPEDVQAHEDLRRAAGVVLHVCHPAGGRLCQATSGTFHGLAA